MKKYDDGKNLKFWISSLYYHGHDSSVWGEQKPPERGHVIEIIAPCYVSKPCWKEIREVADFIDTVTLDYEDGIVDIHQFFFSNLDAAKKMALRVQRSARNIRKERVRRIRLDEAGGFHDKEILEKLFEIQQGCCYFSGDPLVKFPKNFVVDHILSVYRGGTDWPGNLALVIKEINTWKGGHASSAETLQWLAKKRGQSWLRKQKAYCKKVDKEREQLDFEFQRARDNRQQANQT